MNNYGKISHMIEILQELQKEHGDIELRRDILGSRIPTSTLRYGMVRDDDGSHYAIFGPKVGLTIKEEDERDD